MNKNQTKNTLTCFLCEPRSVPLLSTSPCHCYEYETVKRMELFCCSRPCRQETIKINIRTYWMRDCLAWNVKLIFDMFSDESVESSTAGGKVIKAILGIRGWIWIWVRGWGIDYWVIERKRGEGRKIVKHQQKIYLKCGRKIFGRWNFILTGRIVSYYYFGLREWDCPARLQSCWNYVLCRLLLTHVALLEIDTMKQVSHVEEC